MVSGDFYWTTTEENYTFLVTADCTGHGVPGAFMANMGIMFLYSIIKQKKIYSPAEILQHLHEDVWLALKQETTKNNNGMDITVLRLENAADHNHKTKVIFAGAKQNLLYIDTKGQEVIELKGVRRAIGGIQNLKIGFENQEILLHQDSLVYVGSDGFEDQNDINRKKLGRDKIKQVIEQYYHLPLQNQKSIFEQMLASHMQNTSQRDDILWIGFRV